MAPPSVAWRPSVSRRHDVAGAPSPQAGSEPDHMTAAMPPSNGRRPHPRMSLASVRPGNGSGSGRVLVSAYLRRHVHGNASCLADCLRGRDARGAAGERRRGDPPPLCRPPPVARLAGRRRHRICGTGGRLMARQRPFAPRDESPANAGLSLERTTGVEPATPGLGSQCSTTELRPRAAPTIAAW